MKSCIMELKWTIKSAGRSFWKREVSVLNGKDFLAPALKRSPEPYSVRRGNTALIFMDTSNHYEFVTPAPYPVRSKLRRKSGIVRNFWIPAFAGMTFLEVALSISSLASNLHPQTLNSKAMAVSTPRGSISRRCIGSWHPSNKQGQSSPLNATS